MELTQDEEKMLSGGYGEATRRAMDILIKMGEYSHAKRMVLVSWADLSSFSGIGGGHGDSPDNDMYKFMNELENLCIQENVKFRCPTTLADVGSTAARSARLSKMGAQLIAPTGASSPHDIFPLPLFGQYVTPGATNINTFCNSMIGVRGNSEGPIGVCMAAITGKTPEYGYLIEGLSPKGRTLEQALASKKPQEVFKVVAEKTGIRKALEESGVLVADTQGQVKWRDKIIDPWVEAKRDGVTTMVTDSLKDCNAISQQEIDMVLLPSLEKIVKVAITGKLES